MWSELNCGSHVLDLICCWYVDCSQTKRKSTTQFCDEQKSADTSDVEVKAEELHEGKRTRLAETSTTAPRSTESEEIVTTTATTTTTYTTTAVQEAAPPARCNQCKQLLDDPDLKLYPGDHCDAVSSSSSCSCCFSRSRDVTKQKKYSYSSSANNNFTIRQIMNANAHTYSASRKLLYTSVFE